MTTKVISATTVKRLISDIKDIVQNPLSKDGIYYKHDEENMLRGYALIIGPTNTPYAYGNFLFKFRFPDNYPWAPSHVTYYTNDGITRFNPNLYKSIRAPRKDKAFPHYRKLSKREFKEMLSDMLSEDELLLVTLHHYDELTLDEIAFITGADEENVFKAYKKLRNKVKKIQNDQF